MWSIPTAQHTMTEYTKIESIYMIITVKLGTATEHDPTFTHTNTTQNKQSESALSQKTQSPANRLRLGFPPDCASHLDPNDDKA